MGIGILQGLANKYDEIQDIDNITMINSKMTQMNVHSSGSGVHKNNTFHDDSSSSIIYDNFNLNDSKNNDNNSYDNAKKIDSYDTYNEYVRLSNLINDLKPLIIRLEDHLMTKHQDGEDSDGNNNSNNQNKTSSEADINASVDSSSSIRGSIRGSDSFSGDDLLTHSEQSIDTGIYDDDDNNNNSSNTDENESLPISLHILKSIREKLVLHESSQEQQQHQQQQQQQKSVYQQNHSHENDDQGHHLSYLSSRHEKQQQLSTKTTTTTSTTTTPTIIPLLPTPQLEQLISLFDTNTLSEVIRNAWKRTTGVYLMTYISDSIVWPPLQLFNFSFVPVRYQFLYVNTCNLFWNAFLSYVANKKNN